MGLLHSIGRLLARPRGGVENDPAIRRAALRRRYYAFHRLLAADVRALESLAELEAAAHHDRMVGMGFVRSRATRMVAAVFAMIRHLDELEPGRHPELTERLSDLEARLALILADATPALQASADNPALPPIISLDALRCSDTPRTGSKLACLGELAALGLRVPPGFAVTAAGFLAFTASADLAEEAAALFQGHGESPQGMAEAAALVRERFLEAPLPAELEAALLAGYDELAAGLGRPVPVAVRSSCLVEDLAGGSAAGQYLTVLHVDRDGLAQAYKEVAASVYSAGAVTYRLAQGLRDADALMAVGVLAMVDAAAGGVLETVDPVQGSEAGMLVTVVPGGPSGLVDGSGEPDRMHVGREAPYPVLDTRLAGEKPVLSPELLPRLAAAAMRAEIHFGRPQEMEWAVTAAGEIVFLQSRPLVLREQAPAVEVSHAHALAEGGVTASPGVGVGPVFPLLGAWDAEHDAAPEPPLGAVLVAHGANPAWARYLPGAAAMITEHGAETGHLASVAREYGVPALFGLADAVALLQAGTVVTVDAGARRVLAGEYEEYGRQAQRRAFRRGLPADSPVRAALEAVVDLAAPLTLPDPSSADFRARNCASFHDLVRFCHEMALQAMMGVAESASLPELGARRLACNEVASQFWIVDLEDAFKGEPPNGCVAISQVASVPLLALWEGMTAIIWEGPPPVEAGGFFSIVMESMMNPELEPARSSRFSSRNVFLAAKDFVNLQSRFGYHYCMAESRVSERPGENYILFRFQGGAADMDRRIARVRLIAEVLEARGFNVRITEDRLEARVERMDAEATCSRLRLLGYLLMHTRQLDMVMGRDGGALREKFYREIRQVSGL